MPALHQTKALLGLLGWRRQIGPASAFLFCRSSNKEVPKYGKSWQSGENHPALQRVQATQLQHHQEQEE